MKTNTTTFSNKKSEPISFDDVLKAVKLIDKLPFKPEPIEVGGEEALDYIKSLATETKEVKYVGDLYGVEIKTNPLLPKNCIKIGDKIYLLKDKQ